MNLPLRRQTDDNDTRLTIDEICAKLRAARHIQEHVMQEPMYTHTRARKTRPLFRSRMPMVLRGDDGGLMLIDDERRSEDRVISNALQLSFLETAERESRRWHNLDRPDPFAEGALAFVVFKGTGHTILQLRKVPGVISWRTLKRDRIGVIERSTHGLRGERYRLSRLGGDSGWQLGR